MRSQPQHRWASPWLPATLLVGSLLTFAVLSANRYYTPASCPTLRRLSQEPARDADTLAAAEDGGGFALQQPATASSSGPARSNYVLTVVSGDLHQNWTSVFVRSWARHSPATKVVVFVDEVAKDKQQVLRDFGAELIPFTLPAGAFVVAHRFQLWLDWLKVNGNKVAGIMLSDARDVYIQADPWQDETVKEVLATDAMLFTLEGGKAIGDLQIQQQAQNVKWTSKCFSRTVYDQLKNKAVSCAGVTIGTGAAVTAYIQQWFEVLETKALPACKTITGDQAVHNYLLHALGPSGKLRFKHVVRSNWESPVATATYGWPMRVDVYGRLQRPGGTFPAVVHQYDRSAKLRLLMFAQYPVVEEMEWPPPECDRGLLGVAGVRTCAKGERGYRHGQI